MPTKISAIEVVHDALKDIHFDSWIVLDLDNTVMESKIDLGGDAWFSSLLLHVAHSAEVEDAMKLALMIYHEVQSHVRTKPVEPEIVKVIHALQDIGMPVIALTARSRCIAKATAAQLADIGIHFSRAVLGPNSLVTNYVDGIIYCDGKNKGDMLRQFLELNGFSPKHVVMLDDKEKYLHQVAHHLEPLKIDFTGFRYTHLDEKVSVFDAKKANVQLALMKHRLSPAVQHAIEELALHPEELIEEMTLPVQAAAQQAFAHGLFHHRAYSAGGAAVHEGAAFKL